MRICSIVPLLLFTACAGGARSTPSVEATCVICVAGCRSRPPTCAPSELQVFASPGVELHGCRRDGVQPWSGISEWCCPSRPAACAAAVAVVRAPGIEPGPSVYKTFWPDQGHAR